MGDKTELTLPGLPPEIVTNIADRLNDIDVASLHAVNKALLKATRYTYAKRYLTNIHVFLHPMSFDKLKWVASDAVYADLIEHITISTYVLRDKRERRKGTSDELWEQEESFISGPVTQAIIDVLVKARGLKSLTIADYRGDVDMPDRIVWGYNRLNRLLSFKRNVAVVTSTAQASDERMWPMRLRAFEAILAGVEGAKLPAHVRLNMILEGNSPRLLSPKAQTLFLKTLTATTHLVTAMDNYGEYPESNYWIKKSNPVSLTVDYDTAAWEVPNEILGLHLGSYTRLQNLKITRAKMEGKPLNDFLSAHIGSLRVIEFRDVYLTWTGTGTFPWTPIFLTMTKIQALRYMRLNTLAAVTPGYESRHVDYYACQETPWEGELNVSRALRLLCEKYVLQGGTGTWVDLDYVEEEMMNRFGVIQ